MARRKRKDDEPDWVAPEFDEVQYMRTEIEGGRTAIVTIGWAIVGALVSFTLTSVHPALAFFAGLGVGFGLYFMLPVLGIKTEGFKRRDWIGGGATYFFSWLAFWILLLNPPFSDFTDPTIDGISVSPSSPSYDAAAGPLTCREPSGGSVEVVIGGVNTSVYILFRAADNVGIGSLSVQAGPSGQSSFALTPYLQAGNTSRCIGHQQERYPAGTYNVSFVSAASSYSILIVVRDTGGRGEATLGFTVRT